MNAMLRAVPIALLLLSGAARAAAPATFTYSGFLTDGSGTPVTSAATLTFRLYAAASGGSALFTSEGIGVAPGSDGFFSAVIGSGTALPAAVFDAPVFLSVQYGSEAEMSPRVALTSVPSALSARTVDWSGVANRPDSTCTGATPFVVGVGSDGVAKCAATPSGVACTSGQVLAWNGSAWACSSGGGGGSGTVTQVSSGAGLTGGPITTSGTLAVDTTAIQARVTGTCAAGSAVRVIAQDGTVSCQAVLSTVSGSPPISVSGTVVSISQAGAGSSGYVSSTDWNTFNAKLSGVTVSAPLGGAGTAASPLTIGAASGSTSGALSSADWNTFNAKQAKTTRNLHVSSTYLLNMTAGTSYAFSTGFSDTVAGGYVAKCSCETTVIQSGTLGNYYVQDDNNAAGGTTSVPGTGAWVTACITVSTAATTGSWAIIFVNATCAVPTGHGLVVNPMMSNNGGSTWTTPTGMWAKMMADNP